MEVAKFERTIRHLSQEEIAATAISTINKILVKKGIATVDEIQQTFASLMRKKAKATK